jgi:hypothetical protein
MQSSQELELKIKELMLDLIEVLHNNGIQEVHMGGMMRLLGVEEDVAKEYDQHRIKLSKSFVDTVREFEKHQPPPTGTVLH